MSNWKSLLARSPNCQADDKETTLIKYQSDKYDIAPQLVLSCQKEDMSQVDDVTLNHILQLSEDFVFKRNGSFSYVKKMDLDVEITKLSSKADITPKDLMTHKMASNCGPNFNLSDVTNHNQYSCRYLGDGIDSSGKRVRNPFKQWTGHIASCDKSLEISEQLEEDVKSIVYERAGGEDTKMNKDEFLCDIYSFPSH
jgi:hypothetical protein